MDTRAGSGSARPCFSPNRGWTYSTASCSARCGVSAGWAGLDEALEIVNASTYGHTAVVYTEHGGVAREFRQRAQVGQVGVNVGTPAPIAFYPVGGRKTSLFGSNRGRANDAVDFYTDKKVVVTTWYGESGRRAAVDPAFQTPGR